MRDNNPLKPIVDYTENLEAANDQLTQQVAALDAQISGMIPKPPERDAIASTVIAAARYALELRIPYVFGGETYSGLDCSGLTQTCFRLGGVTIPRISHEQAKVGDEVAITDMLPGDLVAMDMTTSRAGIDHVGIYIGNGQILHTNNPTSGVHISTVDDLKAHIVTCRRIIK